MFVFHFGAEICVMVIKREKEKKTSVTFLRRKRLLKNIQCNRGSPLAELRMHLKLCQGEDEKSSGPVWFSLLEIERLRGHLAPSGDRLDHPAKAAGSGGPAAKTSALSAQGAWASILLLTRVRMPQAATKRSHMLQLHLAQPNK